MIMYKKICFSSFGMYSKFSHLDDSNNIFINFMELFRIPRVYGIQKCLTVFKTGRHWNIRWAKSLWLGCQRFGGPCASIFRVKWNLRQHGPLKRWYPTTTLHDVTTQKTSTWNITVVKATKLAYNEPVESNSHNYAHIFSKSLVIWSTRTWYWKLCNFITKGNVSVTS